MTICLDRIYNCKLQGIGKNQGDIIYLFFCDSI